MLKVNLQPAHLAVGSRRVHYAWVMVAVASTMWITTSAVRFAAAMLVPFLQEFFGWSIFAIFAAFAIQWIAAAFFSPIVGWLGDRYGVRRMMVFGAGLFVAGMLLTGTMTHIWQFYVYYGLVLALAMAIFQVPLVAAVTLWFKKHLGVAMGTLQALQGLGTAVGIFIVFVLIDQLGLKWTFWLPGMVGGTMLFLLVRLFYNEPGEIGLKPLGALEDDPLERLLDGPVAKARTSVFLRQAQRTGVFWNLIGIHFWGCAGHNIILMGLVAMAIHQGVSPAQAAGILITLTVVSTITRFAVPVAADLLGSKKVMLASFTLQTFPVLILLFAQDVSVFYMFAVLFGIGIGGEMTAFPIINRQYYGNAPMGTTYGWQLLGGGMGMALGLLLGGFVWTESGSFTGAVWLSFVLSLVGVVSILVLPNTSYHLIPDWEESLPLEARSSASV